MPKKKTAYRGCYHSLDGVNLNATPSQIEESGTVRLGQILNVVYQALEPYPEIRIEVAKALTAGLGEQASTRVVS
ncbi:hypothetical protein [Bryobacter aggregatus]|uniref:hypothetical protein n=1 Tax=Bryobacter aggregatus TaxID=360054 RepID=UPI0004E130EA|nr:hypothetical protein [Bryobacter aggregatus]